MTDTMKTLALTNARTLRLYATLQRVIRESKSGAAYFDAMDTFECHLRMKYGASEKEINDLYFDLVIKEVS